MSQIEGFNDYQGIINDKTLSANNKVLKCLFNLDTNASVEGALNVKIKEMLGLIYSLVSKCDHSIKYHIQKYYDQDLTKNQRFEVFSIANIVGGTIVIPHPRKTVAFWELLENKNA